MEHLIIPKDYHSELDLHDTQVAIKTVKDFFQGVLSLRLNLLRVSAPLFVDPNTGLNDNLNGYERPVSFGIREQNDKEAEVVHSLAKWKRYALAKYNFKLGEGLYTDMNAIRRDEDTDNIHSIFVDQWDWEKVIDKSDRHMDFLKDTVRTVYKCLQKTEQYMAIEYDYTGMLNNIITRRALILQKCNVPSRNDNSGGSTGIAMSDATGWTQAEVDATRQDQIKDGCKIKEIKIVLKAIKKCPELPQDSVLRNLRHTDVKTCIKRQKTYEMTTKINAYATGVSHGIYYEDMINAINLFDDPQQVAENSRETTRKYLERVFDKQKNNPVGGMEEEKPNADRIDQDKSDQESNSKMIGGTNVN